MRARALLSIALLLTVPAAAAGQGEVAQDCDYRIVRQVDWAGLGPQDRSLFPDSAFVWMSERMAANQWIALTDSIIDDVENDFSLPAAERRIFLEQLQSLRGELRAVDASGDAEGFRNRGEGVSQSRFRIASAPGEVYELFVDGTSIDLATVANSAARRALCWRALTLSRMLSAYGGPGRRLAVQALEASAERWDNYNSKGYSQFPWELALNSARFSPTSQNPPRHQLVFLHPSISLELVAPSLDSLEYLRRLDAITVEPIGFLIYNNSRSFYYGLSSLVSLPGDGRVGAGLMAHIGTYGKVGAVLWRADGPDGSEDRSLIVSADLYQFLTSVPGRLREAKARALQLVTRDSLLAATEPR